MRVVGLLPAASKGLQPINYGPFRRALAREVGEVDLWDIEPLRLDRLWIAARTFRPGKSQFRARFYSSPLAFHAYGRSLNRIVARKPETDAVLQFGTTCDAGRLAARWPQVI